jgi:predicted nucleic acid-binding protein
MRIALDTNVLAYAEGLNGTRMKALALDLVQKLPPASTLLPVQVLGELFNVLVRKARRPPVRAREAMLSWGDVFPLIETSPAVMLSAADLATDHQLGIWDAVIVASAADAVPAPPVGGSQETSLERRDRDESVLARPARPSSSAAGKTAWLPSVHLQRHHRLDACGATPARNRQPETQPRDSAAAAYVSRSTGNLEQEADEQTGGHTPTVPATSPVTTRISRGRRLTEKPTGSAPSDMRIAIRGPANDRSRPRPPARGSQATRLRLQSQQCSGRTARRQLTRGRFDRAGHLSTAAPDRPTVPPRARAGTPGLRYRPNNEIDQFR